MLAKTTVVAMVVVAQCQNVVPIAVAKGVAVIWQHVLGLLGHVLAKEVRLEATSDFMIDHRKIFLHSFLQF